MITDINITTSEEEIIGLELAKLHLRVDSDYTEEDALINLAISSARTEAENYIERKLLKGAVEIALSGFESFDLSLQSMNDKIEKVEYFAPGDEEKTELPSDKYSFTRSYTQLSVAFKQDLPETDLRDDAILITVSFGFDDSDCPADIVSAMLLQIADAYDKRENRTALHESAVRNLLNPYRKWL